VLTINIKITGGKIRRNDALAEAFARIEDAGDKSLAYWQGVHWPFLKSECARPGQTVSLETMVALEYFGVVQPCLALENF
jgi:uncharacterized protein YhfF